MDAMTENGHALAASSYELLSVALRTRAETVSELAAIALEDEERVRVDLAALEAAGYLFVDRQRINLRTPEPVVAEHAVGLLGRARTDLDDRLGEVSRLLAALPAIVASWSAGAELAAGARPEVYHGAFAATDLWRRIAASRRVSSTDGALPDAARIFGGDARSQKAWFDAVDDENLRVRTLLASADVTLPGAAEVLAAHSAIGSEFRMMPDPPSWFWIVDDDTVGMPLRWGETWPTSVMAIEDPAVVTLVRWLFDRLWSEAVPVGAAEASWDSLLALMSRGATLEAASHALGISARTGRRRIAAALDHFDADGMFALGAAWQRARSARE